MDVVFPHSGILFSSEKEWDFDTFCYLDEPWKHWVKEARQNVTCCVISFIWNTQNRPIQRDRKKSNYCQGQGARGMESVYLVGTERSGVIRKFRMWREVVAHTVNAVTAIELCTLKWLIACHVNFTSIKMYIPLHMALICIIKIRMQ